MADRRRFNKELHENSWHPDYGWQILRRTPSYREAVTDFIETAKHYGDDLALELFAIYSESDPSDLRDEFDLELDLKRIKLLRDHIVDNENYDLISRDRVKIGKNWRPGRYLSPKNKAFTVDLDSPHYRAFFERYGDVIRYPISPKLIKPKANVLNALWTYRPVLSTRQRYLEILNGYNEQEWFGTEGTVYKTSPKSKISFHIIMVNENYSSARVAKEAGHYFESYLSGKKYHGFTPRWNKTDFNDYLKVVDLLQEYEGRSEKIGYKRIAKLIFGHLHQEKNAKEMIAKRKLAVVKNQFLKIFHRDPIPRARKSQDWSPSWKRSRIKSVRKI